MPLAAHDTEFESKRRDCKDLLLKQFPIDLGYAITFHKVQGQTLDKVVLVLNLPKGSPGLGISLEQLYVGLSRVRSFRDVRILRASAADFARIAKLKSNDLLRSFWTLWDPETGAFVGDRAKVPPF